MVSSKSCALVIVTLQTPITSYFLFLVNVFSMVFLNCGQICSSLPNFITIFKPMITSTNYGFIFYLVASVVNLYVLVNLSIYSLTCSYSNEFLRPQVWVVAEVITSCLNPIMNVRVMNSSRGHWLLLDSLNIIINISFNMEVEVVGLGDRSQILEGFDSKFFILQKNMNNEKS